MARDNNNNIFQAETLFASPQRDGRIIDFTSGAESVSSLNDGADFFKLSLDQLSNIEIENAVPNVPLLVEVIRNANSSSFGDPGETINQIVWSSPSNLVIDGLQKGDYFLRVSTLNQGTSPYTLNVKATAGAGLDREPNGSLPPSSNITEFQDIGVLNGERIFEDGTVTRSTQDNDNTNDDTFDIYRFRVGVPTKFNAELTPSFSNVNMVLEKSGSSTDLLQAFKPETTVDSMASNRLDPGTYFLKVFKAGNGNADYDLSLFGTPLNNARMSVTVNRVEAIDTNFEGGFFESGQADFFTRVTIDGQTSESRVFQDQDKAEMNFNFARNVSINKRFIAGKIEVFDEGNSNPNDDRTDLSKDSGRKDIDFTFDTLTGKFSGPGLDFQQNGNQVTVRGEGDDFKAMAVFTVSYNSLGFGAPSFASLESAPITIDSNQSRTITGKQQGGILDGRGGHDDISGMGGDDVCVGGIGNDTLNGGTGNDITYGGVGNDVYIGSAGRDTFVLDVEKGVDVIRDFQNNRDKLGLTGAVNYELLDIRRAGKNLGIYAGEQKLAVLQGVRLNQIDASDFVKVDFATIQGIETPYVVV